MILWDLTGRTNACSPVLVCGTNGKVTGWFQAPTDAYGHDEAQRNTVKVDPLDRRTTFAYDDVGNQTLKRDPRGNRITMVYDAANRPVEHRYPDGRRHTFSYDQVGNRTVMADPTGRTTTVYDDRSNPVRVTNPDAKAITYAYDAVGRRCTMVDPDDGVFTYTHDAAGRLAWLENPQGQRTTFTYDGVGRQTRKDLASGTVAEHTYFDSGRLKVLLNTTSTGTIISSFTYTYDPAGNRTSVLESDGTGVAWRYDNTYQLVNEARGTPTTTLTWDRLTADQWDNMTPDEWATMAAGLEVDGSVYNTTYTYDPAGNRLVKVDSGAPTSYTYDAANELLTEDDGTDVTTYTYDASGNRDTKETPSEITYYTWNEDNRMTEAEPVAGPVTFTYDAAGRRVGKATSTDTKKFIYDFDNLLQETDGSDSTQHEYTTTVEEYGDLVSEYDGTDTSYHHYDALGSTDALTDPDQTSTDTWTYKAFGEVLPGTGTTDTPFGFVGKQGYYWDPEIELYFLGAHTPYDPRTGRFVRPDPIDADSNPYRYVRNNPANAADPSGLQTECGTCTGMPDESVGTFGGQGAYYPYGIISPEAIPSSTPGCARECPPATRQLDMGHIPADRVEGLVADGIATAFEKHCQKVVVTPFILNGRVRNIVLMYREDVAVGPVCHAGAMPRIEVKGRYYAMVGDGPITVNREVLADVFVFDRGTIEATQLLASVGTFALHFLPGGAAADYYWWGEGEGKDVFISTLADVALCAGVVAKIVGKGRTAIVIARGAAAVEAGVGGYRACEAVSLTLEGEYIAAAGAAGEATLRLFGASALWRRSRLGGTAGHVGAPPLIGPKSLTKKDVADIQRVVNKYRVRVDVGGSRARAAGRNICQPQLAVDKGPGTRSDIDFIFDLDHPKAEEIMTELRRIGEGAGSLHPDARCLSRFRDAGEEIGPGWRFRFEPYTQPRVLRLPPERH